MEDDAHRDEMAGKKPGMWGDVHHFDGNVSRLGSEFGPNAGRADGFNGKTYDRSWNGEFHENAVSAAYGASGDSNPPSRIGGNMSEPVLIPVGGVEAPRPAAGWLIVGAVAAAVSQSYTRAVSAFTDYPIQSTAWVGLVGAVVLGMVFFRKWRTLTGLLGGGAALVIAGAWVFPNQFGVAGLPLLMASLFQSAAGSLTKAFPWMSWWVPVSMGAFGAYLAISRVEFSTSRLRLSLRALLFVSVSLWAIEPWMRDIHSLMAKARPTDVDSFLMAAVFGLIALFLVFVFYLIRRHLIRRYRAIMAMPPED